MERSGVTRFLVLTFGLALVLGATSTVRADDWEDGRKARLEEAVEALEQTAEAQAHASRRGVTAGQLRGSLMSLRHGRVLMVGDLARADHTLEITNNSAQPMEWRRSFAIDPQAEAIGAYLQRGNGRRIEAQTLTLADARRIYGEIRTPRSTRTVPAPQTRPRGDPLRIERPSRSRMDLLVWPIAPGETVRVGLEFVTPLRGRGENRMYVDPIQADLGNTPRNGVVVTESDDGPAPVLASMDTHWIVDTGRYAVSRVPPAGMVPEGRVGGFHHYRAPEDARRAAKPRLPLHVLRPKDDVLAVPGGGLGTRVACWHFDPIAFLEEHDLEARPGDHIRLLRQPGSTSRIAPWEFDVTEEPKPVTARLLPTSHNLRYTVEVVRSDGNIVERIPVSRPVIRTRLDPKRRGAITGWHRAAMAQRVIDWARGNPVRSRRALDFAVDLGVLTEGTAALAVPENERRRLSRRSRRQYWQDGAPLGAQNREADFKGPPSRSTSK